MGAFSWGDVTKVHNSQEEPVLLARRKSGQRTFLRIPSMSCDSNYPASLHPSLRGPVRTVGRHGNLPGPGAVGTYVHRFFDIWRFLPLPPRHIGEPDTAFDNNKSLAMPNTMPFRFRWSIDPPARALSTLNRQPCQPPLTLGGGGCRPSSSFRTSAGYTRNSQPGALPRHIRSNAIRNPQASSLAAARPTFRTVCAENGTSLRAVDKVSKSRLRAAFLLRGWIQVPPFLPIPRKSILGHPGASWGISGTSGRRS